MNRRSSTELEDAIKALPRKREELRENEALADVGLYHREKLTRIEKSGRDAAGQKNMRVQRRRMASAVCRAANRRSLILVACRLNRTVGVTGARRFAKWFCAVRQIRMPRTQRLQRPLLRA